MPTRVSSAVNADATHLHLQILLHGFDSFEHLSGNPVEEISFKIGEDMRSGPRREDLTAFLFQDPIVKDQLGDLCSLHRCLDDERGAERSWQLELAIQLHDRRQIVCLL